MRSLPIFGTHNNMGKERGRSQSKVEQPRAVASTSTAKVGPVAILLAIAALLLVTFVRIRLLNVPLDRDEGEYAYVAQQWLQGVPPFVSIYHMKLPGTYLAYMLILQLFGETTRAVHWGLLLVNLASTVLVFLIGRRLFDPRTGIIAAVFFALLTISKSTEGFTANAEHFVLLPALLGLLFLLRSLPADKSRAHRPIDLLLSGLLLGISVVMKQQGVFFLGFGFAFVVCWCTARRAGVVGTLKLVIPFSIASVLPYACVCLLFQQLGLFEKFWWWTVEYPRYYGDDFSVADAWYRFTEGFSRALRTFWGVLVLSVAGLFTLKKITSRHEGLFLIGWSLASICAVIPGYHFFPHYFLLITPALALLAAEGVKRVVGYAVSMMEDKRKMDRATYAVLITSLSLPLIMERDHLFNRTPAEVSRASFSGNPFPESEAIARYLNAHSSPDDRIAIVGSEPEILFHAKRRSATGFLYVYEMVRDHRFALPFQKEMMKEIVEADPALVLFVHIQPSWLSAPALHTENFLGEHSWALINEHYVQAGIVDIGYSSKERSNFC